jgi:hypothetical protein
LKQAAVSSSPPRQGFYRPALKRNRVPQSGTTKTRLRLASPTIGLGGDITVCGAG